MQSGHNQTATVRVLPQSKGNAQIISRRTSVDLFTRFGRIFILLIRIPFMLLHNIRSSFALYKPHSHYTNGLHKMHSFFTLYKALSHYTKLLFKPGVTDILYQNRKTSARALHHNIKISPVLYRSPSLYTDLFVTFYKASSTLYKALF